MDIYATIERFKLDMLAPSNIQLLGNIFDAKRVSPELLGRLAEYREFHAPDFQAVKATVKPEVTLQDFDFYFGYVVTLCERLLEAFGNV